jgi:hypothetical protein
LQHGSRRSWRAPEEPEDPPHPGIAADDTETASRRRLVVPRTLWIGSAIALIVWQAASGRPGVGLLVLAAVIPLLALPRERSSPLGGLAWPVCAVAPVLGLAGLAGAFPAIAGQARRWRERAALGALAYWWLTLAAPLAGVRLWLAAPSGTPARAAWEGSLGVSATDVIGPMLNLGLLFGAALWAAAAISLPWLVRGRSAALDAAAAGAWSALVVLSAPALDAGLSAHAAHPSPRGAILGALLGAMIAVAARALRGPV